MTNDALFDRLKHPNPNLRERAMLELAENMDDTTIPRLMGILAEENMTYRRAAVKALGVIGFDAVPSLVDSLEKSDNPTVRTSCTKALAQVAVNYPEDPFPAEGIAALKKAVSDSNPVVNIAAVMALGAIGSSVLDILIDTLRTTDNIAVSVAIINALGSIADTKAAKILTELARDDRADTYVKESARSALSRLEMVSNFQGRKS